MAKKINMKEGDIFCLNDGGIAIVIKIYSFNEI